MIYGTSYIGNRMTEHFLVDLKKMKQMGLKKILLTFSENDLEYYQGTLTEMTKLAKNLDMEVYLGPWGFGGVFGGEAYSKYVSFHRDSLQVLSNGEKYPAACMNNPAFREFFKKWIKKAVATGCDTLFFDEPHFFVPGWKNDLSEDLWGCGCDYCKENFKKRYGFCMPLENNKFVKEFKRYSITRFIEDACREAKAVRPDIQTSVCLITNECFLRTSFPEEIGKISQLDEIATDPYWGTKTGDELNGYLFNEFSLSCDILNQVKKEYSKKTQIWIKNFLVKKGSEEAVSEGVRIANRKGMDSVMAWSYEGTKVMSSFSCQDPGKAWNNFIAPVKNGKDL